MLGTDPKNPGSSKTRSNLSPGSVRRATRGDISDDFACDALDRVRPGAPAAVGAWTVRPDATPLTGVGGSELVERVRGAAPDAGTSRERTGAPLTPEPLGGRPHPWRHDATRRRRARRNWIRHCRGPGTAWMRTLGSASVPSPTRGGSGTLRPRGPAPTALSCPPHPAPAGFRARTATDTTSGALSSAAIAALRGKRRRNPGVATGGGGRIEVSIRRRLGCRGVRNLRDRSRSERDVPVVKRSRSWASCTASRALEHT